MKRVARQHGGLGRQERLIPTRTLLAAAIAIMLLGCVGLQLLGLR